jgi:peroxiredoxin
VAQLRRAKNRFDGERLQIVLIGMGSPEETRAFQQQFDVAFPIVCDPDRELYRACGLREGTLGELVSPGLALRSLKALGRGHLPGIPREDVRQMPGTFIVDRQGLLLLEHYAKSAADHLPPDSMLSALKKGDNGGRV